MFRNKLKLINLYQLQHIQGLTFKAYQDEEKIRIKDGMLKLQKTLETSKNYDSSFYEVWLKAFINYTSIISPLFRATAFCL